ncbi:preprotein translocase subunit SecA [Coraliomargarita akajimensis]|uniref:Protein translocase subunit SecA n=1 Tax=Coraliomargarita akajimensis (strain DSM 45221 / IAM 15411 / JCM 23193 / KCTC 12865 / 04OKA010-24) TaxID=583355 RepID=D5ELA3_CORAD|nr:preprotein translocase subunit SecA [Coraliomargarita akajimensis]ADE55039.1 preprotein translocase, SecA subunit [Coraliomargarita akajimensis DSM 45221]
MISKILKKFSGRHYTKYQKQCEPIIARINALEVEFQSLSDEQLRAKTAEYMERFQKGETLDDLLPEAFATVKNAARRMCGNSYDVCDHELPWEMVHYDVQLLGGIALHQKRIAEMATGEGKTLVSTCPLYLNALSGRNCQLITVNDYLARRDSEWMGHLFKFLGLTVGCIQNSMNPAMRREMYGCNITYGTASEFGFDYLRDNGMATSKADQVQRDHFFCIIDEVDSILVDEARTPLIISGPMQDDNPLPFQQHKGSIERLVAKQQSYCQNLIQQVEKNLKAAGTDQTLIMEAMADLWQVKQGMPKNEQLMQMNENVGIRRALDKFDLEMASDFNKEKRYALKEELYYVIDEKNHQADLTEKGRAFMSPDDPDAFMLPDLPTQFIEIDKQDTVSADERQQQKLQAEEVFQQTSERIHCISQLLRAYSLYDRDKEYVVQQGKVNIVDQNTGRVMPGRRWSDGLHQAVEAKENCTIEKETKTYATVTIQNYFRMYEKIAGMTGTAETEAAEFSEIYGLSVMIIPTNKPNQRTDKNDVVYKTRREKFGAVMNEIQEAHKKGQPVLVGTASVEASEALSQVLKRAKIVHSVLNAKFHEKEAEIVARAGQKGAVTIATNMAGRGTDIKLGEGVEEVGGLFVIGTERHESRRIDRQLRGRCARQGDKGMSKFFVSLEDDLMRLFANAGPISKVLEKSMQEGEELEHGMLNWSIENAQKKVEQQNFSIRKRLLQFDDVLNTQREVVYGIRNEAIQSDTPIDIVYEMIEEEIEERLVSIDGEKDGDAFEQFIAWTNAYFPIALKPEDIVDLDIEARHELIVAKIKEAYAAREEFEDREALTGLERYVVIRSLDRRWQDHLTEMEELRRAVNLRGYGQKDPLNEYKSEAFKFFEELMTNVRTEICHTIFRSATNQEAFENMLNRLAQQVQVAGPGTGAAQPGAMAAAAAQTAPAQAPQQAKSVELPKVEPIRRELPKVGRNETVTIRKGDEVKQVKFKKAESMILNDGWDLVK